MPGYGIAGEKGGAGLFSWKWATERLVNGRTYWLATTRPDGRPHVMPIWGIWADNAFYFSTGDQSRKAKNLAVNAQCSVATEIDLDRRPRKGQIKDSLIIEGIAEKVADRRILRKFGKLYQDKYDWDMEGFSEPVYRVRPKTIFGFAEGFTETATRWVFDE
jgi:nitroimidazol reductase NimA-like FMN-containing flavoprotein (pyridoxamine 5'-phosphate oxidase superfamily)